MQIQEKQWFFSLVKGENALCKHANLESKFIVCYHIPKDESDIIHLFSSFNNPLEFTTYMMKIPMDNWSFFEVIAGNTSQKPYIDVDISDISPDQLDIVADEVMTYIVNAIVDHFTIKEIPFDLNKDLMIFSSHSDKKRSFHIVINGYHVPDNGSNGSLILKEILWKCPNEYLENRWIDQTMYKSSQQFRLYMCGKAGTKRRKMLMENWSFGSHQGSFNLDLDDTLDHSVRTKLKFNSIFTKSCISYIDHQCKPLPIPVEKIERRKWVKKEIYIENTVVDKIMAIINREAFAFREMTGDGFNLKRLKPSFCEVCQREHQNDNAKITIREDGTVYFHCYRNKESSYYLGTVPVTVEQPLVKEAVKEMVREMSSPPKTEKEPSPPKTREASPPKTREMACLQTSPPKPQVNLPRVGNRIAEILRATA